MSRLLWVLFFACSRPQTMPADPPQDVVLIMLCTARADQFSSWGGDNDTTPFLSSLVASGVRFERTIAQAPWTRPASVAILTGHTAADLGMVEPGAGRNERVLDASAILLSERMRDSGFQTLGLTANPNLNGHFGFDQGFDTYLETSPLMRDGGVKVFAPRVGTELAPLAGAADPTRPLYLQLMLVDAHRPFPRGGHSDLMNYRVGLRRLDDGLRELVGSLKRARPGLSRALWVVVGDHGEGLLTPKHHGTSHGTTLYPSVTHVPLAMWGAGIPSGGVIHGLSAQVDVVPTVLGLLRDPIPADLSGVNFSDEVAAGGGVSSRTHVFSATWFRWSRRAARTENGRFCQWDFNKSATRRQLSRAKPSAGLYAFPDGCFDGITDPQYATPLLDSGQEQVLQKWFRSQEENNRRWETRKSRVVPADIDAQLKALGYAE
jgi:arylsulfatase A-like enzyme